MHDPAVMARHSSTLSQLCWLEIDEYQRLRTVIITVYLFIQRSRTIPLEVV